MVGAASTWWIVGWIVGGAVVLVAAGLLIAIIALARRIVGQAGAIVAALDGARANTAALFDIASINYSLDQITRKLREVDAPPEPEPESGGLRDRIAGAMQSLREGLGEP